MNKADFNPLSWSILFFSMWYTLKSINQEDYGVFAWVLFGMSIILLISIYWGWLRKIFNHQRSVRFILPTIFILTVASFIFSVLFALKDLSTTEQYIALTLSFVLLGTYISILISTINKLNLRIACVGVLLIVFLMRLITNGIEGSWPLIIILIQGAWGAIQPNKFNKIPLV